MGFGQGLSGLNAAAQNLDIIGNNIANSGTVGFKAATASFADVYASSRVGLGAQVASINQRFTIGTVATTGNQFDMAIDGAKGLFRVVDPSGAVLYTRNGQFSPNKEGYLTNAQGHTLTAYMVDQATGTLGTTPAMVRVPTGNIAPKATTEVAPKMNLDADEEVIGTPSFPNVTAPSTVPDPKSYNHSLPMTVYDSLGNAHQLTQYFVKQSAAGDTSVWDVHYQLDSEAVHPTKNTLTFTSGGVLDPATAPAAITFASIGGTNSPAEDLVLNFKYDGTTQFGDDFGYSFTQDGYGAGAYASMSIATDGSIVANYTNGKTMVQGMLTLADFPNLQGLQPVGGNAWVETSASGQPILGTPGTNGLATIAGQAVEESNVDMSQELVNMIIAQRTYQANAQTIKTQDQILQTLITMR
ncbi:flagellar hook protein FlgE [Parapusillimonas granuli]|uniref:Flagellar hook protein FlgE n=1 Tax=Parapusillimonas granuli TaxID=380911 RepID=A0A853FR27_9BURK|nr:flagellar hook protein FlgE [Parapusillimonas granuli]MBB5213396.1 flagellar hook protein FlgE [Parapusillimonas granuli]MEB2398496.1 flagellar hook protein FlgE [Alcaligenaceae bacterium]NYT48235.1 flagellar hook protein FlgE [Parapusillimonas granuli]